MNFLQSPNIPNQMKIESTHHRSKHLLTYSVFVTFILKEALYVETLKHVATHISTSTFSDTSYDIRRSVLANRYQNEEINFLPKEIFFNFLFLTINILPTNENNTGVRK